MHPAQKIKHEHSIILKKIHEIEQLIIPNLDRKKISELLQKFLTYWTQHEKKEEQFLEWFDSHGSNFPHSKTIINDHESLRGHWKVLQTYLKYKTDSELAIALENDGKMIFEKLKQHISIEDKYFEKYFRRF